jgi:hypothetical protein
LILLVFLVLPTGITSTWVLLGSVFWVLGGFKVKGVGVAEANIFAYDESMMEERDWNGRHRVLGF